MRLPLLILATFAAVLLSYSSFGQGMPSYHYTPPVMMPNMNMPLGGYGNRTKSLAYRDGAGSYQLPDGSWHHTRKLVFDGERLTVKDSTAGKLKFTAQTLRQVAVKSDTFLVVKDLPGRREAPEMPDFVRSCVNRQGVRLLARYYESGRPVYFLSRPNASLQLLPAGKADFKKAMLEIVKDSPVLTARITKGELGRDEVVQIVQTYAEFLRTSGPAH